jgi:hypothetical protein
VLATNRGAVPEVVLDGVTGFVRDTPAELVPLVSRIGEIDRAACRRHVAEWFSSDALVRGYSRLLASAPEQRSPAPAAPMVFSAPVPPPRPMRVSHEPPRLPHDSPRLRRPDRPLPAARRVAG